jgi:hypothetical protein
MTFSAAHNTLVKKDIAEDKYDSVEYQHNCRKNNGKTPFGGNYH